MKKLKTNFNFDKNKMEWVQKNMQTFENTSKKEETKTNDSKTHKHSIKLLRVKSSYEFNLWCGSNI